MDDDFGLAMKKEAKPDIMDILTGRLFFWQFLCYINMGILYSLSLI